MTDRTPLEMLETLVLSIKTSTEDADRTNEPLEMVYNYRSVLVQEAQRVIDKHKVRATTP